MAAGLQIFDASGNLVLDATHRVMRVLDSRQLMSGINGSFQDDRLKGGGAGISFQPDSYIGYLSGGLIHPQFSFDTSAGTISWSYAAKNNTTYDSYVSGYVYFIAY
jgi:hypothetical protein